jgi:hypothetical protein
MLPAMAADPPAAEGRNPLDSCEHYPLSVGREWTFASGPLQIVERVAAHETVGDELCARVETSFGEKVVGYEHLAVRKDGVYRVAIAGKPVEPPLKFLALPAAAGQKWSVNSTIVGQNISGEFETSEGKVSVAREEHAAIAVECKKFRFGKGELSTTSYFVPGIGKVKQVVVANGQETTLELQSMTTGSFTAPRDAAREL